MGYLVYNDRAQYRFDDRTLSHLKIAITSKLRLQEGFLLSWRVAPEDGGGRISIWLSPSIQLQFLFNEPAPPPLNPQWLEALARSSHGLRGMVVMAENEAAAIGTGPVTDAVVQQHIRSVLDEVSSPLPPRAVHAP
ncbi:hypothetical protein GCM10028798_35410 [Humibacter antri]